MSRQPVATRCVADVDVLLVDLFVGNEARDALDRIREHTWIDLFASDRLIDVTVGTIATLADDELAATWRRRFLDEVEVIEHPPDDHPALASAYAARAAHLLTYDDLLRSPKTGLAMRARMPISIRDPGAFLAVFDPASLYEATFETPYPGPDRDPRG